MVIAAIGTVLAAGYLLWLFQRTAFGSRRRSSPTRHIHDVHVTEWLAWAPMLVADPRARRLPAPDLPRHRPGVMTAWSTPRGVGQVSPTVLSALAGRRRGFARPDDRLPRARARARPRRHDRGGAAGRPAHARAAPSGSCSPIAGLGLLAALVPVLTLAVDGTRPARCSAARYVVDNFALRDEGAVPRRRLRRRCCCRPTTSPRATTGRASTTCSCCRRCSAWR